MDRTRFRSSLRRLILPRGAPWPLFPVVAANVRNLVGIIDGESGRLHWAIENIIGIPRINQDVIRLGGRLAARRVCGYCSRRHDGRRCCPVWSESRADGNRGSNENDAKSPEDQLTSNRCNEGEIESARAATSSERSASGLCAVRTSNLFGVSMRDSCRSSLSAFNAISKFRGARWEFSMITSGPVDPPFASPAWVFRWRFRVSSSL